MGAIYVSPSAFGLDSQTLWMVTVEPRDWAMLWLAFLSWFTGVWFSGLALVFVYETTITLLPSQYEVHFEGDAVSMQRVFLSFALCMWMHINSCCWTQCGFLFLLSPREDERWCNESIERYDPADRQTDRTQIESNYFLRCSWIFSMLMMILFLDLRMHNPTVPGSTGSMIEGSRLR